MKFLKITILIVLISSYNLFAQELSTSEVYQQIEKQDSLLFNVGFNTCNLDIFKDLIHEDFEMYHDKGGILQSKTAFIEAFKNGLCSSPETYQSRREHVEGTFEVFALKNNGTLYGALQNGSHRFYEKHTGQAETAGNIARYSHLWLLVEGEWQLTRSLSYDHLDPPIADSKQEE